MKRIGILTAGGDTPALNATIFGAVQRANQLRIEVVGIIKGYSGLLNPEVPHVHLNPLFQAIPELDADPGRDDPGGLARLRRRRRPRDDRAGRRPARPARGRGPDLRRRRRHAQRHAGDVRLPADRAGAEDDRQRPRPELRRRAERVSSASRADDPRGLRSTSSGRAATSSWRRWSTSPTPGYATSVFVSAQSIQRIRTTAESHRRVAIVEVMGRDCGMIALGTAFGQPDLILVPEVAGRPRGAGRAGDPGPRPPEARRAGRLRGAPATPTGTSSAASSR